MSSESEDYHASNQHVEMSNELEKKLKISYTRDFLLSMCELDVCKKLPSGFDESLLSEFEDTSQDHFRISGGLSSQSFRRNEYGSSPPTRGDSGNSWGTHGRWDSRSSAMSERDSDSQSDQDLDSGRRYGNQSRQPGQVSEHDGLLGSGSFPRPSGYTGTSGPKSRSNDRYRLNKSNEPYQPPRPYKAVPHLRREINDSYNDETFGSSECTSEDRVEEERKRRASFELMRKEQQKSFQEKQMLNPEKFKDEFDVMVLLEDSKDDKGVLNKSNESTEPAIQPPPKKDADKYLLHSPAPVSRPLVPPGFSSTVVEKIIGTKSSINPHPLEVSNEFEDHPMHPEEKYSLNGTTNNQEQKQFLEKLHLNEQKLGSPTIPIPVNSNSEKILNLSSTLDVSSVSTKTIGADGQFFKTLKLSEELEASENSGFLDHDSKDIAGSKIIHESAPANSTSILEKLFGSALTVNGNGSSTFIENHDAKWSPHTVQSSKFAQWFVEEEKKPVDLSSGRPNDLLSLIVGGEKSGSQTSSTKPAKHTPLNFPLQISELADKSTTLNLTSGNVENVEQLCNAHKPDSVPAVLTCEDLEQSILSEITESGSTLPPPLKTLSVTDGKTELPKADIDDCASQHLLSLLHKGTDLNVPSADIGITSSDKIQHIKEAIHNSRELDPINVPSSAKPLTLETLFGTAFMKELQSVGAPASGQRSSAGSARVDVSVSHGLPFTVRDDGPLASTVEFISSTLTHGTEVLAPSQRLQIKSERIEEHLSGFDPQNEMNLPHIRTEFGSKLGSFEGSAEFQLPEEESLIAVSDPLNLQNFIPLRNSSGVEALNLQNFIPPRNSSGVEVLSALEKPVDIAEKLAALNSVFSDERTIARNQGGPPFLHGSYDAREPDFQYHNLPIQPSSPQLQPPQLNRPGPMFHQLDPHPAHTNAQMKFMTRENIMHDTHNQIHGNMLRPPFHHPGAGPTAFDTTTQNPMLQQMHMPGGFPPPHLSHGFPRSSLSHPNSQVTGFVQEPSPMQGFPFCQRQPNFGGPGIPSQGPDVGGGINHPEALQRLVEMERRTNSKQIHPFATADHSQGMYGHELDMGYRYR